VIWIVFRSLLQTLEGPARMSNLTRLVLRSPLALVLLAFILLVILGSSSAPSYQIYKDASAKDIYNAMKDTLWRGSIGREVDVESFYHNRTSRWNSSVRSTQHTTPSDCRLIDLLRPSTTLSVHQRLYLLAQTIISASLFPSSSRSRHHPPLNARILN
jgi:hypothetical protein